jgi:hypothetical protein
VYFLPFLPQMLSRSKLIQSCCVSASYFRLEAIELFAQRVFVSPLGSLYLAANFVFLSVLAPIYRLQLSND